MRIRTRAEPAPARGETSGRRRGGGQSRIRPAALALGIAVLLAGAAEGAERGGGLGDLVLKASSETSYYADSDNVSVVTPVLAASVESPLSGWSIGGHYLVDVVTAASVDIVATASPTWQEVRHAFSVDGAYKPGDVGATLSAGGSVEPDYVSLSAGAGLSWDVLRKRATLTIGYGYGHDVSGRSGTPFSVFGRPLDRHSATFGVSWAITRATLATVLADGVFESGDPSKPYRYVPMFDPGAADGLPAGAAVSLVNATREHERPLEQLPLSRGRFALTGRVAHRFSASTLRFDERLYADTWGVRASTTDVRWLIDIGRRASAGPHLRVHAQTGATFWQRAYELVPGPGGRLVAPALRTGDRELGPLTTFTGGLSVALDLSAAAGTRAWVLDLRADGMTTHHLDALYIERRNALFAAATLAATFE